MFAPNAPLRPLITARAQEDNAAATAQVLVPDRTIQPQPASPTQPDPPRTGSSTPSVSRPSRWAALLARIYETFPLIFPACQTPLTFIAFLTEPEPIPEDHFDQSRNE